MDIETTLQRIHEILVNHPGESAAWVASVIDLYSNDETRFYQVLNSKRMWGGAGSVANQALADNPGIDERIWLQQIHGFRELMIELGMHLQERGNAYPDISSWLLAFSNWNQSEV
jgi:hypothetical protein